MTEMKRFKISNTVNVLFIPYYTLIHPCYNSTKMQKVQRRFSSNED